MIVLVDMDDVMADTSEYLYKILRANYPKIKAFKNSRTNFNIKDEYSFDNLIKVQSVLYSSEFQLSIPPVQGALEAATEIHDRGHKIFFCSAPHEFYETSVLQKYQWLEKHLERSFARRLILTDDKTLIRGDLLIDDKPVVTGLITPSWQQILFTRSYNSHVHSKRRLDRWSNWKNILTEL